MEPVTHALTSLALARAGFNQATRLATPMMLIAGVAADADWLCYVFGPQAFLRGHRTLTHSLAGTAAIVLLTAAAFAWFGRKHPTAPVRLSRALLVCSAAAGFHLLMDGTNSDGVKLLWPFRDRWYAWDLLDSMDPWVLAALLVGLLLPGLFRLVGEEIGARPKSRGASLGAIVALAVTLLYAGGRWVLHERALEILRSRLYQGQTPRVVGAFPISASPLTWVGIVETDYTLRELDVSLAPGRVFDPDAGRTHFKPEPSPALEAARQSKVGQEFLSFARFPKATVEKTSEGYRVELDDLRFGRSRRASRHLVAFVELNPQARVLKQELRFAPTDRR